MGQPGVPPTPHTAPRPNSASFIPKQAAPHSPLFYSVQSICLKICLLLSTVSWILKTNYTETPCHLTLRSNRASKALLSLTASGSRMLLAIADYPISSQLTHLLQFPQCPYCENNFTWFFRLVNKIQLGSGGCRAWIDLRSPLL